MTDVQTEVPDNQILNMPQLITDNFTKEFECLDYKGEKDDIKERLKHKVFKIWEMWDRFSKDETLAKAMNHVPDDRESEDFKIRQVLLFTYEQIGYILKSTDIIEEMLEGCDLKQYFDALKTAPVIPQENDSDEEEE